MATKTSSKKTTSKKPTTAKAKSSGRKVSKKRAEVSVAEPSPVVSEEPSVVSEESIEALAPSEIIETSNSSVLPFEAPRQADVEESLLELDSGPRVIAVVESESENIPIETDYDGPPAPYVAPEAAPIAPPPPPQTFEERLAAARERNRRAAEAGISQETTSGPIPELPRELRTENDNQTESSEKKAPILNSSNIILGALTGGSGACVSWSGSNELTRAQIVEVLRTADLPLEWAPSTKSPKAQASHAISTLSGSRYVAKPEKGLSRAEDREYIQRWTIGVIDHSGNVGDSLGDVAMTVVLNEDTTLTVKGPPDLRRKILDEYRRRCNSESFTPTEVSKWIGEVVEARWGARKLGANFYIPCGYVPAAKRLVARLRAIGWGDNWFGPIPCATTEELIEGIAESFIKDAESVLHSLKVANELAKERFERAEEDPKTRRGRKPLGRIGEDAAITFRKKLIDLAEQAIGYRVLIGPDRIEPIRERINSAIGETEAFMDDTAKRGALIWDEIERETRLGGLGEEASNPEADFFRDPNRLPRLSDAERQEILDRVNNTELLDLD